MDVGLLQSTLLPFRAVINHYLTGTDEHAARARTEAKESSDGRDSFYAQFMVPLDYLCKTKGSVILAAQEADPSITPDYEALLDCLQDRIHPEPDLVTVTNFYTKIYYLRDITRGLDFSEVPADEFVKLSDVLQLRDIQDDVRENLVEASLKVVRHVEQYLKGSDPKELKSVDNWATGVASKFCRPLKELHGILTSTWKCQCPVKHKHVYGSFLFPCDHGSDAASCILAFPRNDDLKRPWRVVDVHISENTQATTPHDQMSAGDGERLGQSSHIAASDPASKSIQHMHNWLARLPESTNKAAKYCLGSKSFFETEKNGPFGSLDNELIHINDFIANGHLRQVDLRQRIGLAILVAYAFMELGGGPWWSYHADQINIWLMYASRVQQTPAEHILQPFVLAGLNSSHPQVTSDILFLMNENMPNLPILGKLILELLLGRAVPLENIREGLQSLKAQFLECDVAEYAITPCLGFNNHTIFKSDTIYNSERLRQAFLEQVIYRLNYLLVHGSRVDLKSLLQESHSTIRANRGKRRRSTSSGPSTPSKRPRSSSPQIQGHYLSLTSSGDNQQCLHDDDTGSQIDMRKANFATSWLDNMERVHDMLRHAGNCDPVKVAIIDTGVCFDDKLSMVYENRIAECRSWTDPSDGEDGRDIAPGIDSDGHGTQSVIAFLKAASSECSLYVARVFQTRTERLNAQQRTADTHQGVANAIRYAVKEWKVNVISMSFGYADSVKVINASLNKADKKGVLLLAAASNVGGNEQQAHAWPAKRNNVICVHATDGKGNPYDGNPTRKPHQHNVAILGEAVQLYSIPDATEESPLVYRSGTSIATPIASAVAAAVMEVVHKMRQVYIETVLKEWLDEDTKQLGVEVANERQRSHRDQLTLRYQNALESLGKADGMNKVFCLMTSESERQGYDYIEPQKLLRRHNPKTTMIANIIDALK